MPCLLALFALITPRVLLIVLWLFTTYLHRAYETAIWPVLGFFFLPFTTLAYAWAINTNGSVNGIYFFAVLLAALIDLGAVGGGASKRRKRKR